MRNLCKNVVKSGSTVHVKYFRRIAEARKGEEFKETDLTIGQTAIEFEDANEEELRHFHSASRITGKNSN